MKKIYEMVNKLMKHEQSETLINFLATVIVCFFEDIGIVNGDNDQTVDDQTFNDLLSYNGKFK